MNYYEEIKQELINNKITKKVKDYSKNRSDLETYYNVGKLLVEAGNKYGDDIIGKYSKKLVDEVGKKYDKSTLFKIRKFYLIFSNEKVAPMVPQLNWSQCLILLPIKDIDKINYYMEQISKRNLSKRELQNIIKNKEYERLPKETKEKLITKEHIGQIEAYMNYIDKNLKLESQNKTIGIILVRKDNKYIVEYSSDPRIISREYQVI